MPRIRTIKPEFPQSESMGRVSRESRLCFVLLWTLSDDVGRLRGNSRMLASLLYPYDDDAKDLLPKWLTELEREHCIEQYEVSGDSYVQICNWLTHQKIDHPSTSKLPAPRKSSRTPRESSRTLALDQGRDQGKERDQGPGPGGATPEDAPVITLPLNDGSEHPVTKPQVEEWGKLYPAANVEQELRGMRGWLSATPQRRKTKTGINKFINAWLARVQNQGRPSNVGANGTPNNRANENAQKGIDEIRRAAAALAGRTPGADG